MTICIASSNYYPSAGGIATFTYRLAALLHQNGHKAVVLTVDPDLSDKEDSITTQNNGVIVVRLNKSFQTQYTYYQKYFRQGGIDAPYWIAMGIAMKDWLIKSKEQYNFDLIDASAYGGFAAFLQHPSLPPVVLSGHGAFFQYKALNENRDDDHSKVVEQLERMAFKNANAFICHSPQSKADIETYTRRPVYQARIPFLFEKRVSGKTTLPTTQSKYALVVGSLQKLKGPEVLCEALSKMDAESNLAVTWIGSDNYRQANGVLMSKYLAAKYPGVWGISLQWKDYVTNDELFDLYEGAKFILIPSLAESFNVISIEAAFHGKPVIITEKTGSSFLFKHKEDAWIIKENNSEDLLKAIEELDKSPELCAALGQAAKEKITSWLTPAAIVSERMIIYEKVIQEAGQLQTAVSFDFLDRYTTKTRKCYYRLRQQLKKIIGRS